MFFISGDIDVLTKVEATNVSMRIIDPNFDSDTFWKSLQEYCNTTSADLFSVARHCVRRKAANEPFPWEQNNYRRVLK